MTPPDVRNEWTVGYIVNLRGSVVDRWRADGGHRAGRAFALASRETRQLLPTGLTRLQKCK
jgi:hypothetical protein